MEQEMKTINLEEILSKHDKYNDISVELESSILSAMKEACKQTLELASENAETTYMCSCGSIDFNPTSDGWSCKVCGKDPLPEIEVNKQSILDTINQIK